jgi:hypothetical protein
VEIKIGTVEPMGKKMQQYGPWSHEEYRAETTSTPNDATALLSRLGTKDFIVDDKSYQMVSIYFLSSCSCNLHIPY